MSLFQDWLERKQQSNRLQEDQNSINKFKFNPGDEEHHAVDYEHVQTELFKLAFDKYPQETMQFFRGLAQRGDDEIVSLVSKLDKDQNDFKSNSPSHPSQKDEIVPPTSDIGWSHA